VGKVFKKREKRKKKKNRMQGGEKIKFQKNKTEIRGEKKTGKGAGRK
jgi:hypothetical protein